MVSLGRTHSGTYVDNMPPNAHSLIANYIKKSGNPEYIADACVPAEVVAVMRGKGQNVLSINEIDATTKEPMSDIAITNISNALGIPVITLNIPHFLGCEIIPLKATGTTQQLAVISSYQ